MKQYSAAFGTDNLTLKYTYSKVLDTRNDVSTAFLTYFWKGTDNMVTLHSLRILKYIARRA